MMTSARGPPRATYPGQGEENKAKSTLVVQRYIRQAWFYASQHSSKADRASPVQVFSAPGLEAGEERRRHARVDAGQFGGVGAKVVEFQLARRLGGRLERSGASSLGPPLRVNAGPARPGRLIR